jgi:hypothetical protein
MKFDFKNEIEECKAREAFKNRAKIELPTVEEVRNQLYDMGGFVDLGSAEAVLASIACLLE